VFTLSKSVSRRWEKVNESTRKAGVARVVRLRHAQKEGGGGREGSGHAETLTFRMQCVSGGGEVGTKGGGGMQMEGDSMGGGGRMAKWM
jgi:hypothetical protein